MFRDFSDSAKTKLLEYVADVTATTTWGKITDELGDIGLRVQYWLGFLSVSRYVDDLDTYHKKVIDMNDTTKEKIEEIFTKVKTVDGRYEKGMSGEVTTGNNIVKLINDLANAIDPSGGNLNMKKLSKVLQADIDAIEASQATTQKEVEDQMLGTDPEAASTSVDPVNLSTGNFIYDHKDLSIEGEVPVSFHRYYNSKDPRVGTLGKSFRHNYEIVLLVDEDHNVDITMEDGRHLHFVLEDKIYVGKNTIEEFLAVEDGKFKLILPDRMVAKFDESNRMVRKENENGVGISFTYDDNGLLKEAKADNGVFLHYEYDSDNQFLIGVVDHTGRKITMEYNENTLATIKFFNGKETHYKYTANGRIIQISGEGEGFNVRNEYDIKNRVTKQNFPDGSTMSFLYDDDKHSVTQIERNGVKTVFLHDDEYRNTEIRYEDGTTETFLYNERSQCIRYKDRLGNVQRMSYDNRGNMVQKIDAVKRRFNMTYDVHNNLLCMSVNGKKRVENHYDKAGNLLSTEDYYGTAMTRELDREGRPVKLKYPDESITEITYDVRGNIASIKNNFGGVTKYFYNELNQVSKVIDPKGNESNFEYTSAGNIAKETNAHGDTRCYEYNKNNLLTKVVDYNGTSTSRSYNAINKLEKFIDQSGNVTLLTYDEMWNASSIKYPNGAIISYKFDHDNRLSEEKDGLGNSTFISYNANGECTSEIRGDRKTFYEYDAVGRLVKLKEAENATTEYQYDDNDNIIYIKDALGNEVFMAYDEANHLLEEKSSIGEIRTFTYTKLGLIGSITDEMGRITKYEYVPGEDLISRIVYPDGMQETYSYDVNGNLQLHTDRAGNKTTYFYDSLNRMSSFEINGKLQKSLAYDAVGNIMAITDGEGFTTKYCYSPRNEMIKTIDAKGHEALFEYDANGMLISQKQVASDLVQETIYKRDPLGRISTITDALGESEFYSYNIHGELVKKTDKDGFVTNYAYSDQGDVKEIEFSDGRSVKMSYNALRQLEEIQDWTGTTRIKNDAVGRALEVCYPDGQNVQYTYNTVGRRTSITYPNGDMVHYDYDQFQRLSSMVQDNQKIYYEYGENGNLCRKTYPNGIESLYGYNEQGFLHTLLNQDADGILDQYEYEYDAYGKKVAVSRKSKGLDSENGRYSYEYDCLERLTSVRKDSKLVRSYEYDSFGNRTKMSDNGKDISYTYNRLNQLVTKTDSTGIDEYSYDRRGNLIGIKANGQVKQSYEYGAMNYLEKATDVEGKVATYAYNGLGHRIGKTISEKNAIADKRVAYVLDMTKRYNNLLIKEDSNTQSYFWDQRLVSIADQQDDKDFYCLLDGMGSPIRLLDETGNSRELYDYDEFGRESIQRKNSINPFGFTGYERDEVANSYYAQAREYLPTVGRFAARDFVKGSQAELISLNEYLYCKDDPNDYVDLNGMFIITATLCAIGAAAVAGAVGGAVVDAVSQGVKIAQHKQKGFKVGECLGSAVEGAVVGGVAAIPGVGPVASAGLAVGSGVVGAAANSTISQAIDNGSVNVKTVAEDGLVGGVTAGVFHGAGKLMEHFKPKTLAKDAKKTIEDLYKDNEKAISNKASQMIAAIAATGRTSPHRKRQLEALLEEQKGLLKQIFTKDLIKGGKGIPKNVLTAFLYGTFGIKSRKTVMKDLLHLLIPWDGKNGTVPEYLKQYIQDVYGRVSGKCPLYA